MCVRLVNVCLELSIFTFQLRSSRCYLSGLSQLSLGSVSKNSQIYSGIFGAYKYFVLFLHKENILTSPSGPWPGLTCAPWLLSLTALAAPMARVPTTPPIHLVLKYLPQGKR